MLPETSPAKLPQPPLFILEESTGAVELFPAVWNAIEDLTMPDAELRQSALDRLLELSAPRFSPVVAYLLATRLTDPEITLRARIVKTLGEVLAPDENGHPAPEIVRNGLVLYLAQVRTRQVFALLQVLADYPGLDHEVSCLLNACPYAGNHLVDILNEHSAPLNIRSQAARMIGEVGYLDALPALEKLATRLESRISGQKVMPFAPPPSSSDTELYPSIQTAIDLLRAP